MPRELHWWYARRKWEWASEKYITTEVFKTRVKVSTEWTQSSEQREETLEVTPFGTLAPPNEPRLRSRKKSKFTRLAYVESEYDLRTKIKCFKLDRCQFREGRTKKRRWLNILSRPCASLVEVEPKSKALWRYRLSLSLSLSLYVCMYVYLSSTRLTLSYATISPPFVINKRDYIFIYKSCNFFGVYNIYLSIYPSYLSLYIYIYIYIYIYNGLSHWYRRMRAELFG